MTSQRRFYQTVFRFEMLTEEPPLDSYSLEDIHYETTEGHASGKFLANAVQISTSGPEMARLLLKQGTDPEFFCLTPEGEDTEEG